MDLTDEEKARLSFDTFTAFLSQFGDTKDIYARAVMEILIEEIYGQSGDDLHLLGETGQKGNSDSNKIRKREMPTYEID